MRKILLSFLPLALAMNSVNAQEQKQISGYNAYQICPQASIIYVNEPSKVPSFIVFRQDAELSDKQIFNVLTPVLKIREEDGQKLVRIQNDELGFTHFRYQQTYYNIPVFAGEYIVHTKNGAVVSANGFWADNIKADVTPYISKEQAIQFAMNNCGATIYKWQEPNEEAWLKKVYNDNSLTYMPQPELVIMAKNNDYTKRDFRLCWKMDIYASQPMSRNWVYVDAKTGEIIFKENRICHTDVNGTADTRYSGTQTIVTDQVSANSFRLREAGRGQGIETYNLLTGTNYGNAVDFTDADNYWNTTTNYDNAAYDAHWGAEATYDYYGAIHNRNGIDGNGFKMLSYVHYSTNYNNAFWNGQSMTYGDGSNSSGGFTPLTSIDVCGHEFTHGVTSNSANLVYSYQSGALNESFSDIFGTCIEYWKKPNSANFLIGEQICFNPNTALRNMQNPNQYGDPDCYLGTNWYTGTADNGGVHTNSGVQNYWFYLLCMGGSGTNDVGNPFNVTGITMVKAEKIAYRNLTVYLTTNSQYIDARTGSIQAATDLYGACSQEVISTANAWYACNVGGVFSATPVASFTANNTTSCTLPFTVNFSNTSTNLSNWTWNFGDGSPLDNTQSPSHTYTQAGTYTVTLAASGACGSSTTVQTNYITINPPPAPTTTGAQSCNTPATLTLSASGGGNLEWFDAPVAGNNVNSGTSFTTPPLTATTTYYVESQVPGSSGNVGALTTSIGTGANHNSGTPQYLIFNVLQPCTLVSIKVEPGTVMGNRTLNLWDNAGNLIQAVTFNISTQGFQTVTLNLPLPTGTGLRLGGTNMNLYRNNAGAVYPYNLSGLVSITGASAGGGYYYYSYDWVVAAAPCISARTPVTATIGGPTVTYTAASYDTVCVNLAPFALTGGSPSGGTYSGPGVSNGNFDPATAGVGSHTITYTFTDQNNCTGTATQTVVVDACAGIGSNSLVLNNISIYPNPTNGNFVIDISVNETANAVIKIANTLGEIVMVKSTSLISGQNKMNFDLSQMAKGIYFVQVNTSNGLVTKKLTVK